ncbi:hypothetical protein O181_075663 [Austropuccinia psidii MF-1]|uniref:Uncharacterized protein n=1 Tax=Austropuccinia psidii MF-1 TaxID=1389203 RepID=A0A9Q3FDG2_9BASI|nr:hypothetical protein [Austropuccinia psidii MF-1]
MDSVLTGRADAIAKGILASQILSVPFSCSFSSITVMLAWRFLSKTSNRRPPHEKYFEYPVGRSRPIRMTLARLGAVMVATVCLVMTIMELAIVYETAVLHPNDINFLNKAPWTSSLIPLLTAVVSIATQTYFSDKLCHMVQRPKLVIPILVFLSVGSLLTGIAATIALIVQPFQKSSSSQISTSESLFWAYLLFTTFSSGFLMIPMLSSFIKERRVSKAQWNKTTNRQHRHTRVTTLLRLFLSTYTLVFIFDFTCLITSVLSASKDFELALHGTQGFLVLQKLMPRRFWSLVYALLDGIPKNPVFVPLPEAPIIGGIANRFELKPKNYVQESSYEGLPRSKLRDIQTSRQLATEDEEFGEEIFSYSYPPNAASPSDPRAYSNSSFLTKGSKWESVGYSPVKVPLVPKKTHFNIPSVPRRKTPPPYNPKLFTLPPVPTPVHSNDPSLPNFNKDKRTSKKTKHRLSNIGYINSLASESLMAPAE